VTIRRSKTDQERAAEGGKSERSIVKQTGHRSVTVVRRYIRDAELFDDNATGGHRTLTGSRKEAPAPDLTASSRVLATDPDISPSGLPCTLNLAGIV
jgi:hypothetical protein